MIIIDYGKLGNHYHPEFQKKQHNRKNSATKRLSAQNMMIKLIIITMTYSEQNMMIKLIIMTKTYQHWRAFLESWWMRVWMIKMIMVMIMAMTMMTMMMMMIKLIILRVSANARMATRHICKTETFSFPSFQRVMVRNIVTFTSHIFLYRTYIVKRHDAHERNCRNLLVPEYWW